MLYTISPDSAIPAGQNSAGGWAREMPDAAAGLPGSRSSQEAAAGLPAGMIAVRAADVPWPGSAAGTGALVVSPSPVASGEMLVFAHPVTVAPAVAGREGVVRGARLAA